MQEIFERVTKDLQKMHDIVNQEAPGRLDLLLPLTNFHSMLARLSGNRVESMSAMTTRKPRLKGFLEGSRRSNEPDLIVSAIVKSEDEEEEPVSKREQDRKERLMRKREGTEDGEAELELPRVRKAAKKSAQMSECVYQQPIIKEEDGSLIIEAYMKPPLVDFAPVLNSQAEEPKESPNSDMDFVLPSAPVKKAAKKSATKPPSPQIKEEPESDSDTLEITCENGPGTSAEVPEPPAPVPGKRTTRDNLYDMDEEVEEPVGRSRRSAIRRRLLEM